MNVDTFYALVAGTCFALVGLLWGVVGSHPEWLDDVDTRLRADGILLSFLIPGLMSLGAQIGGDNKLVWRAVFVVAAVLGGFFMTRTLIQSRQRADARFFSKMRWLSVLLYAVILVVALFPDLGKVLGLTGLQVEAFMLCLLILIGHGLTWELMTERRPA